MSSPETQVETSNPEIQTQLVQEIEIKTLDEQTLKEIAIEIIKNPDKYNKEARFILTIRREGRRRGCGYRYLYRNDYRIVEGDAIEVTLDYGEYDCNWFEDKAIIPTTVPVIIMERYHDDDPQVSDYIIIHVFGVDGWRSMKVFVPK